MSRHEIRYPNEPEAYRSARNQLLEKEIELRAQVEQVAELRRSLPRGGAVPEDYVFETWHDGQAQQRRMSQLYENGKDTLVFYSFMFGPT